MRPLVVNFNDISTGAPSSWEWDLGNGTTSFLQNPSATYFNPGQYTVKLIIRTAQINRNSESAANFPEVDSIVKTQLIKVYASPLVNFSGTPQSGCFPLTV